MILYHVSTDLDHDGLFTPRIPSDIEDGDGEDNTIKRVCFSSSIEGCLGSMPDGGRGLRKYIKKRKSNRFVKVFILCVENFTGTVLSPSSVSNFVEDAYIHQEYWVLHPVRILHYVTLEIIDFDFNKDTNIITNLRYNITEVNFPKENLINYTKGED